jgi:hypothetical protein
MKNGKIMGRIPMYTRYTSRYLTALYALPAYIPEIFEHFELVSEG